MTVHGDGGKRLLLGHHEIERGADSGELGGGEIGFSPHRREPRGEQQRIVLS